MSQVVLAKRYAKALFELGQKKEMAQAYAAQIAGINQAINSNPEYKTFFGSTAVAKETKKDLLKKLFSTVKTDEEVQAFLMLLIDKVRFGILADIVVANQEILDQQQGTTRGIIKSSQALSETSKKDYEAKISKIMNKKIQLEVKMDSTVLGGVRVEVGGWTFDDSLQTHLNQLSDKILNTTF